VSTSGSGAVSGGSVGPGDGGGTAGTGVIARTGSDSAGLIATGVALVIGGALVLGARRRSLRRA
jgi:LPXTG-motif cell wall-anchored protein